MGTIDERLHAYRPTATTTPIAPRPKLDLVGLAETAEILELGRAATAERRRTDPTFPQPVAQLRCGPIWQRDQINEYLAAGRGRQR